MPPCHSTVLKSIEIRAMLRWNVTGSSCRHWRIYAMRLWIRQPFGVLPIHSWMRMAIWIVPISIWISHGNVSPISVRTCAHGWYPLSWPVLMTNINRISIKQIPIWYGRLPPSVCWWSVCSCCYSMYLRSADNLLWSEMNWSMPMMS